MSGNRSFRIEKKNLKIICAAILFVAALSLLFIVMNRIEESNNIIDVDPGPEPVTPVPETDDDSKTMEYNGAVYRLRDDLDALLLMGIDKFEEDVEHNTDDLNNEQSDFLFILVFDDKAQTVTPIHLNRDTMTLVTPFDPGEGNYEPLIQQLALSHTYGSTPEARCMTTLNAVSGLLLDTPIDHYVSFTMETVGVVNDYYGGVTVTLGEDFTYINPAMEKGVTYTLYGEEALKYIRARMKVGDGTNLERMERHREYLKLLLERSRDPENSGKDSFSLISKIAEYIHSNCSVDQLLSYKDKFDRYTLNDIRITEGRAVSGRRWIEFYPDEEQLKQMVIEVFYEKVDEP